MARAYKCPKCGYHPNSIKEAPIKTYISGNGGLECQCPKCGHEWQYKLFGEGKG